MKPPCKDCDNRTAGCHGSCEQYRAWRTEREAESVKRKLEAWERDVMFTGVARKIGRKGIKQGKMRQG